MQSCDLPPQQRWMQFSCRSVPTTNVRNKRIRYKTQTSNRARNDSLSDLFGFFSFAYGIFFAESALIAEYNLICFYRWLCDYELCFYLMWEYELGFYYTNMNLDVGVFVASKVAASVLARLHFFCPVSWMKTKDVFSVVGALSECSILPPNEAASVIVCFLQWPLLYAEVEVVWPWQ